MPAADSTPLPTLDDVRHLVAQAFPERSVVGFEELIGGFCNTNLKIDFAAHYEPVVLRIYQRVPYVCAKEVALLRHVRPTVPVPEVFHADPEGIDGFGPYAVLEYIDGLTFQQLKRTNDLQAIQEASYSIGQSLAAIGRYQFHKPGRLIVNQTVVQQSSVGVTPLTTLEVGAPYIEGDNPIPRILDSFLASEKLQRRTGAALAKRLHDFVWSWAPRLRELDDQQNPSHSLVHSDFGSRNILVRKVEGKWVVAGVIDWEFAFSGSPLIDVGNFLRYERARRPLREPHFSRSFVEHGGKLPEDWRNVTRVLDLTALCEMLTRDPPPEIVTELLDLIQATLDDLDP